MALADICAQKRKQVICETKPAKNAWIVREYTPVAPSYARVKSPACSNTSLSTPPTPGRILPRPQPVPFFAVRLTPAVYCGII